MKYNKTYFNCSIDNSCDQEIGYINTEVGRYILIFISSLGFLSNFVLVIYNLLKKNKSKNRKVLIKKIFLIFPFTDLLTSIYWLISSLRFYKLKNIENEQTLCAINSVYYMDITCFQFALINILVLDFRKINANPLENILKPNKKFILHIISCIILALIVSGLSEFLEIIGRSPLNTCFINTKYSQILGYIFLIPVFLIILAVIQLIHDLYFMSMFNSDKGIRRIHRKNSCYVFIFCLLHIPFIILMLISIFLREVNFSKDNYDSLYTNLITFITFLTCSIPLIMSFIRQFQGLSRLECINDYLKNKKKSKLLNNKTFNPIRKMTSSTIDEPSISYDPLDWLENRVIEYFMRDILLGIVISLKKSKIYEVYSNDNLELDPQDFNKYSKYEINFPSYRQYNINDVTVERSDYLNFKVIDYAPKCFSYLRRLEKIDIDEMIESFMPQNNSQGIKKSPGKSGSFFISTDDNKYMVKTLRADELELLKHAFLKEYVSHIKKNPDSLLCRLYGMYNIILGQGDEILIIVMRNVIGDFKDNTIVKFDLKGSTYKRKANFDMQDNNNVMKDLDFNEFEKGIILSMTSINKLRDTSTKDSKFLRKSELMDYSLFLVKLTLTKEEAEDVFGDKISEKINNDFIQIMNNKKKSKLKRNITYTGEGNMHDVAHYRQYLFPSLTQGTAYIISIIDYFQFFNFFKYVESGLKTNFFQKKKQNIISCVDPVTYSNRFIKYIYSLTDVKQFLSNEIQEAPKEEYNIDNKYNISDEDSDEEESIFKKYRKAALSLENKRKSNQILLPVDVKPEIQSYRGQKSININNIE